MGPLIIAGLCMAGAVLFTMARINLRRFLGYAAVVDVLFTVLMLALFAGTFSGIVAGAVAGLVLSIALTVLRKLIGYEKMLVAKARIGRVPVYTIIWKRTEPEWKI